MQLSKTQLLFQIIPVKLIAIYKHESSLVIFSREINYTKNAQTIMHLYSVEKYHETQSRSKIFRQINSLV